MSQNPPEPQTPPDPALPQPPAYAQPPAYVQPPSYVQPPPYVQPTYGQPLGYQAQPPASFGNDAESRNVLGILSLVAPFVGFSAVGIVLGHLGLSAVKNGKANNRGIALAGTIVSWVFTVIVLAGIAAAIAIPIYLGQRTAAHESAVRSDLVSIRIAVETYYVDEMQVPSVTYTNGNYDVGGQTFAADSTVTDARLVSADGQSYCIEVEYQAGLVRSLDDMGSFGYGCY